MHVQIRYLWLPAVRKHPGALPIWCCFYIHMDYVFCTVYYILNRKSLNILNFVYPPSYISSLSEYRFIILQDYSIPHLMTNLHRSVIIIIIITKYTQIYDWVSNCSPKASAILKYIYIHEMASISKYILSNDIKEILC